MGNKRRFCLLVPLVLLALSVQTQNVSPRRNLGTTSGSRNVSSDPFGRLNRRTEVGSQRRSNERNRRGTVETEQQNEKKGRPVSNTSAADEVTLVVSGQGTSKDEATKVALRNAIERAFGTFVSSNTSILNFMW